MVKVKNPFAAIAASGTLGGTVQFADTLRGGVAGRRRRPKQPRTEAQRATRLFMTWLCNQWSGLSTAELASWAGCDDYDNLPPYHRFLKYNLNRIKQLPSPTNRAEDFHQWPSATYPAPEDTSTWDWANHLWTPGVHQLLYSFDVTNIFDPWLLPIFRISPEHPKPVYANLVHLEPITTAKHYDALITNLPAGEQTFKYTRLPRSAKAYRWFSTQTHTILD